MSTIRELADFEFVFRTGDSDKGVGSKGSEVDRAEVNTFIRRTVGGNWRQEMKRSALNLKH
jgi:hypothetical protein